MIGRFSFFQRWYIRPPLCVGDPKRVHHRGERADGRDSHDVRSFPAAEVARPTYTHTYTYQRPYYSKGGQGSRRNREALFSIVARGTFLLALAGITAHSHGLCREIGAFGGTGELHFWMCGTEGSWYLLPTLPLCFPCERRVGRREGGPHTDGYNEMGWCRNQSRGDERRDGIRASPTNTTEPPPL